MKLKLAQLASILILAHNIALAGQTENQGTQPISIAVRENTNAAAPNGGPLLEVDLQNTSQRAIVAYVLRVDFKDSFGKVTSNTISRITSFADATDQAKLFTPGKQWRHQRNIYVAVGPGRQPRNYVVSLDYVRFVDGSGWGPDTAKQADKIRDFLNGFQSARKYYQQKLKREGSDGLVKDLNTPTPADGSCSTCTTPKKK